MLMAGASKPGETTAPAATTQPSPSRQPFSSVTREPMNTSSPTTTWRVRLSASWRRPSSSSCALVSISWNSVPMRQRAPMRMPAPSAISTAALLIVVFSPISISAPSLRASM